MLKKLLFSILPFGALAILCSNQMSDNGKAGKTGAPGETTCVNSCHNSFSLNAGTGSISLQSSGTPGFAYTPGQTYTMSVTVAQTGVNLFGVGIEALINSNNNNAGTLNITDVASTQIKQATVSGISRRNIVHTLNGGASPSSKVFNFSWTAPAQGTGDVTFYFAGVAANGNTNEDGDYVYSSSQVFHEACATPTQPGTVSGNVFVCDGVSTSYSIPAVTGATAYTWSLPSGWTGTSTTNSINIIANTNSGSVSVTADNTCGSSSPSSLNVTVNPLPAPVISFVNDTLYSTTAGSYQWYQGGNPINGATYSYYVPATNGIYAVEVEDANTQCNGMSADYTLSTVGIHSLSQDSRINAYPNPAKDLLFIKVPETLRNAKLSIYSITGQKVLETTLTTIENTLDVKVLPVGTYTLVANINNERAISRILISKD